MSAGPATLHPWPAAPRSNEPSPLLPAPPTTLVGRETEARQVQELLDAGGTRLLTLTGPGGIGKTRLALAVAAAMEPDFAHGARFVGFASVRDPGLIPAATAQMLGLQEAGDRSPTDTVVAALRDRHLLLVLDNLEHLIEDAALWTGELLDQCPRLTVLATSRIPLQIAAERRFPVPPLALPDTTSAQPDEQPPTGEAAELFVQRARAVRPDFELPEDSLETVRTICLALDGLPLAIELAAARSHVLSPAALLARLTDRLTLLQGGARDATLRHRTMRDTIAWSHDLLSPEQRVVFRRLSVFTGGFTMDAAEAVGGVNAFDLVTDLIDHSLIQPLPPGTGEDRYRMLEVVREFGIEQLEAAGESETAHDAMAAWCKRLASDAAEGIQGSEQIAWLGRLDAEYDTIRRALSWLQERERIPEAQDLAGAMSTFLVLRAYHTEARAWYETLVTHPLGAAPTIGRAWCLCGLGIVAFHQGGDGPRSLAAFDDSVAICRQLRAWRLLAWVLPCRAVTLLRTGRGDAAYADCTEAVALAHDEGFLWGEAGARSILGQVLSQRGDLEGARFQMQTGIDLCTALGESWLRAVSTGNLAVSVLMSRGELDLAVTYLEESDRLMRLVGDRLNHSTGFVMRAEIARVRGDAATAEGLLREALAGSRETNDSYATGHALRLLGVLAAESGDVVRGARLLREALAEILRLGAPDDMAACLDGFADAAIAASDPAMAARLIGANDAALATAGASRPEFRPDEHHDRVATIAAAIGEDGYRAAWESGQALAPDQMIAEALAWEPAATDGDATTTAEPGPAADLSRRELEVLRLMADGLTNQQIADRLFVSRRTATSHASNILAKLDLPSRTAAVAWALRNGIA